MITVSVDVSRLLDFVSQNIGMCHLRVLAFIMSVFPTNMAYRDPVFCLQMTHNFYLYQKNFYQPVKAIPPEMFLSGTKRQLKVWKTVSVFLRWYELLYPLLTCHAKYDSVGYASREQNLSIVCHSISLSICCIGPMYSTVSLASGLLGEEQLLKRNCCCWKYLVQWIMLKMHSS